MKKFDNSLFALFSSLYPEREWSPLRFGKAPQNYWSTQANQKKFMDELGDKLGIHGTNLEGWYQIPIKTVRAEGGGSLLYQFNNSLSKLLKSVYPGFSWDPLKFGKAPQKFWSKLENQKPFLEDIGIKLGIPKGVMEPWYKVKARSFIDLGGGPLLNQYNNSMHALLSAIFPDFTWNPLNFTKAPQNYWGSIENQRNLVLEIGQKLGIAQNGSANFEEWYNVSNLTFIEQGGGSLLSHYQGSLPDILSNVFPEYDWKIWKFPGRSLSDERSLDEALTHVEAALMIVSPKDWYRVTTDQLESLGLSQLTGKSGGLISELKRRYPQEPWDEKWFALSGYKKASQGWLASMLREIFPAKEEIFEDYLHPDIKFPVTGQPMQLDAYLPKSSLAFEYQGKQHYEQLSTFGKSSERMERDNAKERLCNERGITLISVPFWWNKSRAPLLESILEARPDLFDQEKGGKLGPFLDEARQRAN